MISHKPQTQIRRRTGIGGVRTLLALQISEITLQGQPPAYAALDKNFARTIGVGWNLNILPVDIIGLLGFIRLVFGDQLGATRLHGPGARHGWTRQKCRSKPQACHGKFADKASLDQSS